MSSTILYKNLFEVNILHHYFLDSGEDNWDTMTREEKDKIVSHYDIREFFEITPTLECRDTLNSYKCVFRMTSGGILVGIKAEPDGANPGKFKPFKTLSDDLTFRFLIRLRDSNFMNYTALPLQGMDGKIFIFMNYTLGNKIRPLSISALPPVFKPATVYMPGDMLSDDANNQTKLFTALLKTSNNTSTAGDWLTETGNISTPLNYANVNDLYPVVTGLFTYTMKEVKTYPVATFKNFAGDIIYPRMEVLPGDYYSVQAELQNFSPGFYSVHIVGDDPAYHDDVTFYLLGQNEIPFGVIEIKVKSDSHDYDLTDPVDLLSPAFELRFRNRHTFWRYFSKSLNVPYVVDKAKPLTRFGFISIEQPFYPKKLPNPSDSLVKPEALTDPGEKNYYSDIHIN